MGRSIISDVVTHRQADGQHYFTRFSAKPYMHMSYMIAHDNGDGTYDLLSRRTPLNCARLDKPYSTIKTIKGISENDVAEHIQAFYQTTSGSITRRNSGDDYDRRPAFTRLIGWRRGLSSNSK